jgi:hypothetical protein
LWIDSAQRSAVHRHIDFAGSNPSNRIEVEWKQRDFGWWPEKWTLIWSPNGRVRRIHRFTVETFDANPNVADVDFTLPAKPGMKVLVSESPPSNSGLNPFFGASKTYLVLPSGSWQEIDAKGFTTKDGKVLQPVRSRAWIWWTVAGVLVAGIGWHQIRRRQRAPVA